ncbi:hypothetical protein JT359_01335 [Candidatus Poribacteria bacterium]|nr:hypothetical protein [Candidatus Poribacteria bacterium]
MLTENILRNVADLTLPTPSGSKPFIPWVLGTSAALVIVLMLGISKQYSASVQEPYSLESNSEIAVEIIETSIVQNVIAKGVATKQQINPKIRNSSIVDRNGKGAKMNNDSQNSYSHWGLPEYSKLRLGKGKTNDIEFTDDGSQFAVATSIGIWIYDAKTGKELSLLQNPVHEIRAIALSPDSKIIAAASSSRSKGEIQFWDVTTQKLLTAIEVEQGISNLFFSEDGTKLASTGSFGGIEIWDISNILKPEVVRQVRLEQIESWDQQQLAELSPDMRLLAITKPDWKHKYFPINLYDAVNGELIHSFTWHTRRIKSIAFSPDSKFLISGDEYETIRLWNTETGKSVSELHWQRGSSTFSLAFSRNGEYLASGHRDGIKLWRKSNKTEKDDAIIGDYCQYQQITNHKDYVYKFAFSPDENSLLSASKDGTIRAWDTTTGEERFVCIEHIEGINSLVLSKTGDTLTTLNHPYNPPGEFQIRRWDIEAGELLSTEILKPGYLSGIANSLDNKMVVMHDVGGKCVLRNMETDSLDLISRFSLEGYPRSGVNVRLTFSKDSTMLAAGGEDGSVHVWKINVNNQSFIGRLSSGFKKIQLMFKVNGHSDYTWTLAFSPDGQTLATGGKDKVIHLWNVSDGNLRFTLTGHESRVDSLAFSPDGKTLASGSGKLYLWDVETGKELNRIHGERRLSIDTLIYSPDGNTIIMGGSDGINLYDTRSDQISNLHLGSTDTLKFSGDGKTLMSVEGSGSVLFWDWDEIVPIP